MNLTDQIKLMRSIFDGRGDAYGLETSLKAVTVRQPLTDDLISDHIEGKKRIGFFPLLQTGQVKVACIDLDREDKEVLTKVIVNLLEKEFYPYTEKSKSRGYHVWVFFDELVQASLVRDVLSQITGDKEIEIFPKQDTVKQNNGLGNFVFLPLHGESVKNGRTVFLNSQFQPYENQWDHLSKVHRTKAEIILSMTKGKEEEPKGENSTPEGALDLSNYLITYNTPFREKKEPARTIYTLEKCLWSENHTTPNSQEDSAIIQGMDGKLTYFCFHNHCQSKTWADARKKISGDDPLTGFLKKTKAEKSRNLAEDLREWIETSYGNFTTAQIYNDLNIRTPAEKTLVRVNLHRWAERGTIARGLSNGTFRKIDHESNLIVISDTISKPLPIKLPGEIEQYVKIMRKSTIALAGTMQAGKTAYLLNTAWMNKDLMPTYYFSSEFGADELRERLEPFGYPIREWKKKVTFIDRSRDFQDVIKPDGLNPIDYLEVSDEGEFFKMGIQIKRIYEKLNEGVAIIGLQKKFGSDFGYGGQPTADKPRLYISLEGSVLKIVKAKLWATNMNPNGMTRRFNLVKGAKFSWERWEFPQCNVRNE